MDDTSTCSDASPIEKFAKKYELTFPLASDADHQVAEAYGVWGEKKNYGRTYMGIIRSAFLIDEKGKMLAEWDPYAIPVLTEVAGSDVSRLKRFAVRFSKMVLPGDDLETRIWAAGSADGTTSYAFETARVGTDEFAITDGLAVIAEEN